jgi:serine/threonine-protein kinase
MLPAFDGCRVVRLLRSDPISDLYDALQEPLGRPVLVKALSPSILPSSPFAASLEREARVLATLDHPSVLRLLDFVRRGDRMWLVLEHVDGWELREVLAELRAEPPPRGHGPTTREVTTSALGATAGTALALQVARAIEHAHEQGVIHRDIAPHSVLVDRSGTVKVTGFSVRQDEIHSSNLELVDTTRRESSGYLSPEQILGEPADPRGDFFSLGVLLYELVTGKHPFGAAGDPQTAQRVRHDAPALLSRLDPTVPGSLERLVARCLEKMPGDRFQSAGELCSALEAVLAELGNPEPTAAVRAALRDAGLLPSVRETRVALPRARRERKPGLGLGPLYAMLGLMVAGGAIIQLVAAHDDELTSPHAAPLELVPNEAASLRVVATPWAHVFVDGQKVATTPFATPIPLRPGLHYVRLDHPNAPSEERTLRLAPGEAILLDVAMKVEIPKPPPAPPPAPVDTSP